MKELIQLFKKTVNKTKAGETYECPCCKTKFVKKKYADITSKKSIKATITKKQLREPLIKCFIRECGAPNEDAVSTIDEIYLAAEIKWLTKNTFAILLPEYERIDVYKLVNKNRVKEIDCIGIED